jgi:O-acetyl-ADP-ribose deacetylase (regulator of RNase III)
MPIGDEHKLDNHDELLLRQVIAIWIQEGRPASRAFQPNSNDEGQLSSDRNSMLTPREAFEAYIASGRNSDGVWAVSVGEYASAAVNAYSDPLPDNKAHALVDYAPYTQKDWRRLSKQFRAHAERRGRLYPANEAA